MRAGGEEPLGRIDDPPQPAVAGPTADAGDGAGIPERDRGAVVRRRLVPPVGFLPELAPRATAAAAPAPGGIVRAPLALGRRHGGVAKEVIGRREALVGSPGPAPAPAPASASAPLRSALASLGSARLGSARLLGREVTKGAEERESGGGGN